jgi:hypothetical protein
MSEKNWLGRLRDHLETWEPTRLNAAYATFVVLLADLGITLTPAVATKTGTWIGIAVVVLSALQSFLTRRRVYSPGRVEEIATAELAGRQIDAVRPELPKGYAWSVKPAAPSQRSR